MCINNNSQVFFAPTNLSQATRWLKNNAPAQILGSSTDIGVGINKNKINLSRALSLHRIRELYDIKKDQHNNKKVGARVLLSDLRDFCIILVPEFARFLNIFASPQIKNMATLVGNVANASPIADTPPFLMISNAKLDILSSDASRMLPISELYIGYKHLSLAADEIITHISFELPTPSSFLRLYKISQRRDLDIATVNAAFCCDLDTSSKACIIKDARIALGGVGPCVMRAQKTELFLKNKKLSPELVQKTLEDKFSLKLHPLMICVGVQAFGVS